MTLQVPGGESHVIGSENRGTDHVISFPSHKASPTTG